MQALEHWQVAVSQNLANSSTPGYKPVEFAVTARDLPKVNKITETEYPKETLPTGSFSRSFRGGEVRITGNPLDMAVHGDGFFAVRGEGGQTYYTRDGEFHLSADGMLVNKMGFPVLAGGSEVEILPEDGPMTVHRDGTISQNGQNVAQLTVFRFSKPENLVGGNGSYFMDPEGAAGLQQVEDATIMQGQVEMSAVSPLREMVSMIQVARAYEMTSKVIQAEDSRLERAIQAFSV